MQSDELELNKESISAIDKYRLDEEWEGQSDRTFDYCKLQAEAEADVRELEDELKVIEAEAELDIRKRPKKYGIKGTVREGAIKLRIVLHVKVKRTKRRLNKAKLRVGLLKGAVKSLDHRKAGLEHLWDMHKQAYFGKPIEKDRKGEFTKGMPKVKKKKRRDDN